MTDRFRGIGEYDVFDCPFNIPGPLQVMVDPTTLNAGVRSTRSLHHSSLPDRYISPQTLSHSPGSPRFGARGSYGALDTARRSSLLGQPPAFDTGPQIPGSRRSRVSGLSSPTKIYWRAHLWDCPSSRDTAPLASPTAEEARHRDEPTGGGSPGAGSD